MCGVRAVQRRQTLKELVAEASRALTHLDADRLEELALSCEALIRDLPHLGAQERARLASQAGEASRDMAVLIRILDVTRANLNVMNRLHDLHTGRLEYGERREGSWLPAGSEHGDN